MRLRSSRSVAISAPTGARRLDPVTTVPLCLLHMLSGTTACHHLPRLVGQRWTAAALWHARTRVPLGGWPWLLRRTAAGGAQTLQDEGRWRGPRMCLIDGASVSMPDTPALQESCGPPRGQRLSEVGF